MIIFGWSFPARLRTKRSETCSPSASTPSDDSVAGLTRMRRVLCSPSLSSHRPSSCGSSLHVTLCVFHVSLLCISVSWGDVRRWISRDASSLCISTPLLAGFVVYTVSQKKCFLNFNTLWSEIFTCLVACSAHVDPFAHEKDTRSLPHETHLSVDVKNICAFVDMHVNINM